MSAIFHDGIEIRPIPCYHGYYARKDGVILTTLGRGPQVGTTRPIEEASILKVYEGSVYLIGPGGKMGRCVRKIMEETFPDIFIPPPAIIGDTHEGLVIRPIPGHPGYFAREDGRILSTRWGPTRLLSSRKKKKRAGHWSPYLEVRLRDRKNLPVHRLVCSTFHGPCPDGMQCRHLDGDPHNNAASNLRWGTQEENTLDKYRHGTVSFGIGEAVIILLQRCLKWLMVQNEGKLTALDRSVLARTS